MSVRPILLAPNSFKGSLSTFDVCRILSDEIRDIPTVSLPLGDGGDDTAEVIAWYTQAKPVTVIGHDALGRPHPSVYYQYQDTAVIALSEICGLKLLKPEEYDVMNANTRGIGSVIKEAIKRGSRHILLCVGGSASIDAGLGALREMGLILLKKSNYYRNDLIEIRDLNPQQLYEKFKDIRFTLLCDVQNVLYGKQGAAFIFAPQKGAGPQHVKLLDTRLRYLTNLLRHYTETDISTLAGGGAAGGIAASFHALLNAELKSGAEYCLQLSGFNRLLPQAQMVITGEGKLDAQSLSGKIPGVIAHYCRQQNIRAVAIAGYCENSFPAFDAVYCLSDFAPSFQASVAQAEKYLRQTCRYLLKTEFSTP